MASNDAAKAAEELREDMERLKSDVAALVDAVGKVAADRGRDSLRALDDARVRAQAQAAQSVESVERQIAEKPFISVLVAFGAGMLFGKLMDRR